MAAKNEGSNSIIGEGTIFEGQFYIAGSLHVDGKFEGEIITDDDMVIGEKGKVKTNIKADKVIVAGTVIGNIEAREEVRLQGKGKILGNIITPNLHIQNGVLAKGEFQVTGQEKGNIQKIIEDEYTPSKIIDFEKDKKK